LSHDRGSSGAADGAPPPLFHVVLHEPEIPNNTGNIGRTCIATGCALHLVRPLGFDTDVKALRRAGLDYWPRLNVSEHDDWQAFLQRGDGGGPVESSRMWVFTTRCTRPVWQAELRRGDWLVFGKETRGLPQELIARYASRALTLPMVVEERSLNLATAVCAVVYEGLRQCVERGEVVLDGLGRIDRARGGG